MGSGKFTLDATNTRITTNVPPGAPTGWLRLPSLSRVFQVARSTRAARSSRSLRPDSPSRPTFAALKDELTVNTLQLPVITASPTILFPDKDGKEGAVGALMTGSNGVYKVKVPDGNVGSGYLQIPLVGGGVAVSTERFVLKMP